MKQSLFCCMIGAMARKYTGPHDYFDEDYVREWTRSANDRRPFRALFFDAFADALRPLGAVQVLELGSGPGFLAEHLLNQCEIAAYHLLDFSPHMLALSRARLAPFGDRVHFYQGSFISQGWSKQLPAPFNAVISMQAVHEVRRTERLAPLYEEAHFLLEPGGAILIADKMDDQQQSEAQRFTADTHRSALAAAGFNEIHQVCAAGDLFMLAAHR